MSHVTASLWSTVLASLSLTPPTRCPYCPDRIERHWIAWGSYERYAQDKRERIHVPRHSCTFARRTFSLLPDGLLPYHYLRTAEILSRLAALFLDEVPPSRWARLHGAARTGVRRLKSAFAQVVTKLRLPGQEGALAPAAFLRRLLAVAAGGIADIFRGWKEVEPKHSIVGIYAR
jgi:hypothetical protein